VKKLIWIDQETYSPGWLTDVSEISGNPGNGKMSWTIYALCNKRRCVEAEQCRGNEKNGFCTNTIIDGFPISNEEIETFFKLLKTLPKGNRPPFAFDFCYAYMESFPEGEHIEETIEFFENIPA